MRRPDRREAMRHVSRGELKSYDHTNDEWQQYNCDHCDETFSHKEGGDRRPMIDRVRDHLAEEHQDEITRDEYPHEDVFIEWAEKIAARVSNPEEPGKPITAHLSEFEEVKLWGDGQVTLHQFRGLGGVGEDTVALEGNRLVVDGSTGRSYVSGRAFPIDR